VTGVGLAAGVGTGVGATIGLRLELGLGLGLGPIKGAGLGAMMGPCARADPTRTTTKANERMTRGASIDDDQIGTMLINCHTNP